MLYKVKSVCGDGFVKWNNGNGSDRQTMMAMVKSSGKNKSKDDDAKWQPWEQERWGARMQLREGRVGGADGGDLKSRWRWEKTCANGDEFKYDNDDFHSYINGNDFQYDQPIFLASRRRRPETAAPSIPPALWAEATSNHFQMTNISNNWQK